jgi:hypothetical protein
MISATKRRDRAVLMFIYSSLLVSYLSDKRRKRTTATLRNQRILATLTVSCLIGITCE